jgi:Electron transfer DM13
MRADITLSLRFSHFCCFLVVKDAKFWVGQGQKPSPNGIRIADENGKETPLRRYDRKTIVLTLPNDLTVFDIGHFGVWCEGKSGDNGLAAFILISASIASSFHR